MGILQPIGVCQSRDPVNFSVLQISPSKVRARARALSQKKQTEEKFREKDAFKQTNPSSISIMAMPTHLQGGLMPSESNFLAENELITILPRYSMPKLELIGTKIPALRAMRREQVPLWIALILKSQDKCNIVPPEWLSATYLKSRYDAELAQPHRFSALPWHWLETSKILLARAPDDLADSTSQLKSIIQDLREIRLVKSRKGLRELNESNIQLDGLSLLEINEIRPFVLTVMNKLRQLHDAVVPEGDEIEEEDEDDE